jgi:hypothetical protein
MNQWPEASFSIQGVPKTPQNHWNNVLLKFECPSTKLNAKMRKILRRVQYRKTTVCSQKSTLYRNYPIVIRVLFWGTHCTVGPLSVNKCPHCLLAANLIYILASSKRQQFTIKLYYRVMILAA